MSWLKAFLLALPILFAQAGDPSRPAIEGRVLRRGSEEPVIGARLVLARVKGSIDDYRSAISGDGGKFAFRDLPPGDYGLYAELEGYQHEEYGERWQNLHKAPLTLKAGQDLKGLEVKLSPTGVIAGRVLDAGKKPVRNVLIQALAARYYGGMRSLETVEFSETNDLGEYRIFGLPAGVYFIRATLQRPRIEGDTFVMPGIEIYPSDREYRFTKETPGADAIARGLVPSAAFDQRSYFPVYYPAAVKDIDALGIDLGRGATITGIDMTLAPTPTVHVRGRVVNAQTGKPAAALINVERGLEGTTSNEAGEFDIPGIPPGEYEFFTQTRDKLFGRVRIAVGHTDVDNLTITLQPLITLTGRLTLEGPPIGLPHFHVDLKGALRRPDNVYIQPDGTFSIAGLESGDYTLQVLQLPSGWPAYVKSARFGAEDVMNRSFRLEADRRQAVLEIVVSRRTGILDIAAVDEKGQPAGGMPVLALPDGPGRSIEWLGITNEAGRLRVEDIPPGRYLLFASGEIGMLAWIDSRTVERYRSRGAAVELGESAVEHSVVTVIRRD